MKTDSYLKENQLTLNAAKTELLYFSLRDKLDPKEPGETIATKNTNILLKMDSYLKENQLTFNAVKTELLYFSTSDDLEPKVTFNGNFKKIS